LDHKSLTWLVYRVIMLVTRPTFDTRENWSHSIKRSRYSENTIKLSPFRKIPSKQYNFAGISHSVTFGGDAIASVVLVSNHCSQIVDGRRFPDAAQDVGLGSRRRGRVGRRATAPHGGDGARGALRARRCCSRLDAGAAPGTIGPRSPP
jgi:hypothetical protein